MKSSIYVKRQSFEVRLNSINSFAFVAFCQPRKLRYSARDVTDIFAILKLSNPAFLRFRPLFQISAVP